MKEVFNISGDPLYLNYTTPEAYGAAGDGGTDDTISIQKAVDNAGLILFKSGKNYRVTSTIRLVKNTILDLNGATITCTDNHLFFNFRSTDTFTGYNGNGNITIRNGTIVGGGVSFGHGENIQLENVSFLNCLNDHWLEIAGCRNYTIESCRFLGTKSWTRDVVEFINFDPCTRPAFPWLPDGSVFFDGTKNDGVTVNNTLFSVGQGDYSYSYVAFGVHGIDTASTSHESIVFTNNTVKGFGTCGLHLNNMNDVYIAGNRIDTLGDGIRVGDIADVNDLIIIDNYINSMNGSSIVLTPGAYTALTVAGNITKGTVQTQ